MKKSQTNKEESCQNKIPRDLTIILGFLYFLLKSIQKQHKSIQMKKPYKKAQRWHLTQGFHDKHKAIDLSYAYGTLLTAPELSRITWIITDKNFDENLEPLSRGYGIVMTSLDGQREHHYWHCLPIFPVNVGDIVQAGQIVAQMGNSGFVMKGGKFVLLKDRLKYPYPGKHLHYAMKVDGKIVNPLDYINWDLPVNYNIFDIISAITKVLLKMTNLLKVANYNLIAKKNGTYTF